MARKPTGTQDFLVAIDDGYAAIKGIGETQDGKTREFRIPSNVTHDELSALGNAKNPNTYETYNPDVSSTSRLTVTDSVVGESTKFDGYHCSPHIRVLINHALVSNGYGGKRVDLWLALPVRDYFNRKGEKNEGLIDRKVKSVMERVHSDAKVDMPIIHKVHVLPQAVVSIFNLITDENGDPRPEHLSDDSFLIIDIGGRTTDGASLIRERSGPDDDEGELAYQANNSFTVDAGVLDVKELLADLIREKFDIDDEFTPRMLDDALKTKKFRIGPNTHDITELCHQATRPTAQKIIATMRQKVRNISTIHCMLLIGGGANIFADDLKAVYPSMQVMDNPEWTNVRGIYKYARVIRSMED